jgi:hypothetical protein
VSEAPKSEGGIYIVEQSALRIPEGGLELSIGEDGKPSAHLRKIEVSLDVWPYWLDIAINNAIVAREARAELQTAAAEGRDADKGPHLVDECKASMIACSAGAFALDAFYESVREQLPELDALVRQWNDARTPRHRRILETIRRVAPFSNEETKQLRRSIGELFRFRAWAVHPPANFGIPLLHDLLKVGVEWRFVAFRAENARVAVSIATDIITRCVRSPREVNETLLSWCTGAATRVAPRKERRDLELS